MVNIPNIPDLSKSKKRYYYLLDEDSNPRSIISNKGLKKYQKAYITRDGEYHDFTIEAQVNIPPIMTNHHVQKAFDNLKKNNFDKAALSINVSMPLT
jgi:hypothetical protein